jgi:(S)-2-hydroxyglutarate dehydrogenase
MTARAADFLVIGGGIVGLATARELRLRMPDARITVLEKEGAPGLHASGRNSGVLHSGVYYPGGTLKARLCASGARDMKEYCAAHDVACRPIGKLIVPTRPQDDDRLDILAAQAAANGANATVIDEDELRRVEPEARTASGRALHLPDVSVVDPRAFMERLAANLQQDGVDIACGAAVLGVDGRGAVITSAGRFAYGTLVNAAGLHADRIARLFGAGANYTILPFRGMYYRLSPASSFRIRHLLYPVPDLRVPFLGVHFTPGADGTVHVGPSALPALGRENYRGFRGIALQDLAAIAARLGVQYARDEQGFRRLAHGEGLRLLKPWFLRAARMLAPKVRGDDLVRSSKVGLRAQLVNVTTGRLEMDFVIEHGRDAVHVLNAVSPGFTSAFPFARLVVDQLVGAASRTNGVAPILHLPAPAIDTPSHPTGNPGDAAR